MVVDRWWCARKGAREVADEPRPRGEDALSKGEGGRGRRGKGEIVAIDTVLTR